MKPPSLLVECPDSAPTTTFWSKARWQRDPGVSRPHQQPPLPALPQTSKTLILVVDYFFGIKLRSPLNHCGFAGYAAKPSSHAWQCIFPRRLADGIRHTLEEMPWYSVRCK